MRKLLKRVCIAIIVGTLLISSSGCAKRVVLTEDKAFVDFKWKLHHYPRGSGWLMMYGWVKNVGTKRADWVKVTIYSRHKKTGVIVNTVSEYIKSGKGPNGSSLEPGEVVKFEVRLNTKKKSIYHFERDVTWTESF